MRNSKFALFALLALCLLVNKFALGFDYDGDEDEYDGLEQPQEIVRIII